MFCSLVDPRILSSPSTTQSIATPKTNFQAQWILWKKLIFPSCKIEHKYQILQTLNGFECWACGEDDFSWKPCFPLKGISLAGRNRAVCLTIIAIHKTRKSKAIRGKKYAEIIMITIILALNRLLFRSYQSCYAWTSDSNLRLLIHKSKYRGEKVQMLSHVTHTANQ